MPRDTAGLGSSPFDRLYWGNRYYFLLLRVLRCFSSPRSPRASRDVGIAPDGLPHSDILRSMGICPALRLFAACHVLLRLREPRHPPCALLSFRNSFLTACLMCLPSHRHPPMGTRRSFDLLVVFSRLLAYRRTLRPRVRFHHVIVLFPGSPWQS